MGGKRKARGQRGAQETVASFAPGTPPSPTTLDGIGRQPRQWAYPIGFNLTQRPRASETTTFEQLRNLAALYNGIQICERVYFDLIGRLELRVLPRAELLADGEDATAPRWREPAQRIEALLESPDRIQDLRSWLVAFVRDLLEIDAVAVYTRLTRSGQLYALELVAGETIKPLVDEAGRTPQAPAPAYQQVLYGIVAGDYTRDEMDYLRETARTESVYGVSRVERILLRVNQALRKQNFDLTRFTDGATPLGLIQPPASLTWTPDQLETFERAFNGLLAGNDAWRVRAKALPPGSNWLALAGDDPLVEFDRFLLNVTVAAFGLTMDELGFTDTSNRSVGESQQNVVYRRAGRRASLQLPHTQSTPVARSALHRQLRWHRRARGLRRPRRGLRPAYSARGCLARSGRAIAPPARAGPGTLRCALSRIAGSLFGALIWASSLA